jgi:hypothetical protein
MIMCCKLENLEQETDVAWFSNSWYVWSGDYQSVTLQAGTSSIPILVYSRKTWKRMSL